MSQSHTYSVGKFGINNLSTGINLLLHYIIDELLRLILSDHFRDRNNNFIQDSIITIIPSTNIYQNQRIKYQPYPK